MGTEETDAEHILRLNNTILEMKSAAVREKRIRSCLQEFLTNELVRSERLEEALKKKEDELVGVSADLNKAKRRHTSSSSSSSSSSTSTSSSTTSQSIAPRQGRSLGSIAAAVAAATTGNVTEPAAHDLLHQFVRKEFESIPYFGLVVSYNDPFYKVTTTNAKS